MQAGEVAGSWALFLAVASFWNVPQGRVTVLSQAV